ncbi:hypothetical protein [Nostoc sp.]|uniref:hypothetical protein n=1 Tax=Nostoc sp. TaxID=1180 RepID=UPI002FF50315
MWGLLGVFPQPYLLKLFYLCSKADISSVLGSEKISEIAKAELAWRVGTGEEAGGRGQGAGGAGEAGEAEGAGEEFLTLD